MNSNAKGSRVSDAVIIFLFLTYLTVGGYFAFQAAATLLGFDMGKEIAATEVTKPLEQWGKMIKDKVEGLLGSDKPKSPATVKPLEKAEKKPTPPVAPVQGQKPEVKSLKLFEGSKEIPALKARVYGTKFTPQSRFIYVEIGYKNNNYKVEDSNILVVIQYYGPAGELLKELKAVAKPKKEWASAVYSSGWGPGSGKSWQVGTYTVKVLMGGEPVGETTFQIHEAGSV